MEPQDNLQLPFLTRDMLRFRGTARFGLLVLSHSASADTVSIFGATRDGTFTLNHTATAGGVLKTEAFGLPDIPIMLTISAPDHIYAFGPVFISVFLTINGDQMQLLASGYVDREKTVSWPASNAETSLPLTLGDVNTFLGADPAAGSLPFITVPDGAMWLIKSVQLTLVTDATVANRRVHVRFTNRTSGRVEVVSSVDQAASLTRIYSCEPVTGAGAFSDDDDIIIPIPQDIYLDRTGAINTTCTNKQAGDDFSGLKVWAHQFYM